jgi:hypothetical protein
MDLYSKVDEDVLSPSETSEKVSENIEEEENQPF